MGRISFTANLQRHLPCPTLAIGNGTVREVLDQVFAEQRQLRSYILDEHGRLRRHVNIFINDRMIEDRVGLAERVGPDDELFIFQALSGG